MCNVHGLHLGIDLEMCRGRRLKTLVFKEKYPISEGGGGKMYNIFDGQRRHRGKQ